MEWLLEKLDVVLIVVCTNIALMAAYQILEKIKDKTTTDVDNKAYDFLGKWIPKLQWLIDWLSANRKH